MRKAPLSKGAFLNAWLRLRGDRSPIIIYKDSIHSQAFRL